jgi:hypothetical protein
VQEFLMLRRHPRRRRHRRHRLNAAPLVSDLALLPKSPGSRF